MSNYEYITLNRQDEEAIRSFYEKIPTSGDLHFSLNREPGFFDALEAEGNDPEVLIMRKINSGEIIASIILSEKRCYINSMETSIGYMSSLRLAEKYRNRLLGFFARSVYDHQQRKGRKMSLISIFGDNSIAKKNLLSRKGYMPWMRDIGIVHTLIFKPLITRDLKRYEADINIRFANLSDIPLIVGFFEIYGKNKTFFPIYNAMHFNSDRGILKNLKMENIALAFSNDELIGVMGLWDQMGFRNWKIYAYSFKFYLLKPIINLYSLFNRKPLFPPSGKPIDYKNIALVCIRNNDQVVFNHLLKYQIDNLPVRKGVYIAYSMHESNPFLHDFPLPGIDLKSCLYLSFWKEDEALASSLKIEEVYLETGGL
jgi:hypothetical protein